MHTNNMSIRKKPYSKPIITEVLLVANEAVLADCKNGSGIGAASLCDSTTCGNNLMAS